MADQTLNDMGNNGRLYGQQFIILVDPEIIQILKQIVNGCSNVIIKIEYNYLLELLKNIRINVI